MKRVRVMIVEDSLVVRECLKHIVEADPRLELIFSAESAEEALLNLSRTAPDVISLDIRLPGMNGLDATLRIMAERPTPIVVIAADVDSDEMNVSMNALRAGALAVVEKPVGQTHQDFLAQSKRICDQLFNMSSVRVVKQRIDRGIDFGSAGLAAARSLDSTPSSLKLWRPEQFRMLGLVASTGGPNALLQVLQSLPSDFLLPMVMVQHITHSFLQSFATWISGLTPFKVKICSGGEIAERGTIYMAPEDHHLEVRSGALRISRGEMISSQRPSGTLLFSSMAQSLGSAAIGVLLTGMGDDGAQGLLDIRRAGGYTVAEDESTAVVYGMPAVALKIGAVCDSIPLHEIGPAILEKCNEPKRAYVAKL